MDGSTSRARKPRGMVWHIQTLIPHKKNSGKQLKCFVSLDHHSYLQIHTNVALSNVASISTGCGKMQ